MAKILKVRHTLAQVPHKRENKYEIDYMDKCDESMDIIVFPENSDISELKNFRLIPFSTISSSGALPAFLLKKVNVINRGKVVEVNDVYLAVSDKKIVSSDYSVLLGTAFINEIIV